MSRNASRAWQRLSSARRSWPRRSLLGRRPACPRCARSTPSLRAPSCTRYSMSTVRAGAKNTSTHDAAVLDHARHRVGNGFHHAGVPDRRKVCARAGRASSQSCGLARKRSYAQRPARQRRLATNKLLLRLRSGREAPLTEARLLRSLARARRGAGQPPPPGPAKASSKLCRSTSWPVWSVIQLKARWSNSVFCVTRRGVILRPLNS